MQTVDILRDDADELPCLLELRQLQVRGVGLRVCGDDAVFIEVEEVPRVLFEERVAQHGLRRVFELLMVESVYRPEVRDAALGGDAGAAEKDDALTFVDDLLQFLDFYFRIVGHETILLYEKFFRMLSMSS